MDIIMHPNFLPHDHPVFYRDILGFEVRFDLGYDGMCRLEGT